MKKKQKDFIIPIIVDYCREFSAEQRYYPQELAARTLKFKYGKKKRKDPKCIWNL